MTEDEGARKLTTIPAAALVVANMIGTGIFTTTGFMAGELGDPLVVLGVWVAGGVFALSGAAVYGELGAMMPRAGGEYVYLRRAFHPALGFLSGWVSLFVGFSAPVAASAYAFGAYVHAAFPTVPLLAAGASVIVLITALHMADVLWGGRVQTLLSAYKVLLILAFVVAALAFGEGDWSRLTAPESTATPTSLGVSLVFVAFAYSGWNAAAYMAGELRDPGRTLPRSLLGGTAIVLVLYLGLNVVFFYGAPAADLAGNAEEVGAVAARGLFGTAGGDTFSLLIALALVSSISAMVMAGPRVYMAMADDGLFFRALSRRNRRDAPWVSVALQGLIALVIMATATFEDLLTYIGFTLSLFSGLTIIAAFVLRWREPDAPRPYRALGWPVTPLLFLGLSAWMIIWSIKGRPVVTLFGGGTLVLGLLFYVAWSRFVPRR
ncbi:MAG: APC family permease [Myxococcota bacterium]